RVLFNILAQLSRVVLAKFRKGCVTASRREWCKMFKNVTEEEGQPDTFAFAMLPNHVHAVVPVPATNQGQPMFAKPEAVADGPDAVLIERSRFLRVLRRIVIGLLFRTNRTPLQKRNGFFQHASVTR